MHWWQLRKRDADLERELRSDLDLEEEEQRDRGMPSEEARYAARRAFGNVPLIREQTHEAWGWAALERLGHDVRYGFRQLKRSPAFTATAVVLLALGIGAVTAVFSLIDAALLKLLPVEHPDQLVGFQRLSPTLPEDDSFSYPTYKALRDQSQVLAGALAFRNLHNVNVEADGQSALAEGQVVSGNYFMLLGVRAIRGRTLLPADESASDLSTVAVISYDYWRSRFALDPAVIGRKITLNNAPFTIVGVTAPEFYGLQPGLRIDISVPLTTLALVNPQYAVPGTPYDTMKAPFRNWLFVIGRLQPGVTIDKATAALRPVFAASMREAAAALAGLPADSPTLRQVYLQFRIELQPAGQGIATLRYQFSKPLWIVMAIAGLLLLITCANVANLLLARANARDREIAVRLAMGAGKGRLLRQLMTESFLLGLIGGAIGVGLAYWGCGSLLSLMARGRNPVSLSVHPDAAVLALALAISLLTALIFGAIPAARATDRNPSQALAHNARAARGASPRNRLGKFLVIVQLAVSLVLLIAAGLLARTLANLRDFYPGFDRERVLLLSVSPSITGRKDFGPLYEHILTRIRALPGVRIASLSVHQPLSLNASQASVRVQGPAAEQKDLTPADVEPIGPNYFAALQTPILRGREFTPDDRTGSPKAAIVNESMARHFFGEASPIGRFVGIPGYRGDSSWIQIVGEVHDIKVHDLREAPTLMIYLPMLQAPEGAATFEIRTAIDPATIQASVLAAVHSIDPRIPVYSVKSLGDQLDDSIVEERLVASLSTVFGLLALLLTCVGLYGLMAYTVNRRTGEIGIRMALGAKRGRIARMILHETLMLVAWGVAIGAPVAIFASRLLGSLLFGLKPGDPVTFITACALMAAVATIASYLPARRAASVDPVHALRSE